MIRIIYCMNKIIYYLVILDINTLLEGIAITGSLTVNGT